MKSCIYQGRVRHRRFAPVRHDFEYRLFMLFLDLAELPALFDGRWLWSARRLAPAWFRRRDHLGDPHQSLDAAVRARVAQETGTVPEGPIRLLTHLRYFGYCFNPVSLYYCYDARGAAVETILAEVNNTPWGEQHCYVLAGERNEGRGDNKRYRFNKALHVSPFMPMDMRYDWHSTAPGERLVVHMDNLDEGRKAFDATLMLVRRTLDGAALAHVLTAYPLMTLQVIAAIHWQALRLWMKGCPVHSHPAKRTPDA